jgi:glycosyltransferase involved in cell wall biosynthesis
MSYKIAILTNFMDLSSGYSLTGIVTDQYRLLKKYGHDVRLVVNERWREDKNPDYEVFKGLKFMHLKDYYQDVLDEVHSKDLPATIELMKQALTWPDGTQADFACSHDLVFQGWFLPYLHAIRAVNPEFPNLKWLHWIHSVPTGRRPYWKVIGKNHKLIYPNMTDALRCAEEFRGQIDDVRVIHHIKDPRVFGNFSDLTNRMIDEWDLLSADIMQTYPMSSDRFSAKGLQHVIKIFENFKNMGKEVRLVIANQWGNVDKYREQCRSIQKNSTLTGNELCFTSQFDMYEDAKTKQQRGKWELGVPARVVQELQAISNLFIFPTREESFGLVLPEAALQGQLLVLNDSLSMMKEVSGLNALYFSFGSFHINHNIENPDQYYRDIALVIIGKMDRELGIRAKTFMKKMYNADHIYKAEVEPLLAESRYWR